MAMASAVPPLTSFDLLRPMRVDRVDVEIKIELVYLGRTECLRVDRVEQRMGQIVCKRPNCIWVHHSGDDSEPKQVFTAYSLDSVPCCAQEYVDKAGQPYKLHLEADVFDDQ